jgi:hypothetical protein
MSDDIVTRLRLMGNDSVVLPLAVTRFDVLEAADEIERLRRNTGCARNQRSTQFCAEALDAQRDVERLREQLRLANIDNFNTTAEVETLRAERDEARRFICDLSWEDSRQVARQLGWDCYKEGR